MPSRTRRARKNSGAAFRSHHPHHAGQPGEAASSRSASAGAPAEAVPRREKTLVIVVVAVAAALRLTIAVLNDAANDNHLQVVHMLLDGSSSLDMSHCHECFHPKLFYWGFALLVRLLGLATSFWQLRIGQVLNATFGITTVLIVYRFLLLQRFSSGVRILVVALAALNPAFLAINGQFTNDSLVILLSAAGIFAIARYADEQRLRHFGLAAVCLTLAFATKGTSWVSGLSALLSLLVGAVAIRRQGGPRPRRNVFLAAVLTALLLSAIGSAGYDFRSYRIYANLGKDAKVHMFEKTYVARPGVVSIYDSYLTFRLFDLIQHPYTGNTTTLVPLHRSSVFSQLYGRLHFLHLDFWPRAWQLRDTTFFFVGRFNLVLGLVPTGLFLVGVLLGLRKQVVALARDGLVQWVRTQREPDLICLLLCLGYLAFIVKFTYDFRDFSGMKPVYLFPGILGFVKVLADGYQWTADRLGRIKYLRTVLAALSTLLLAGYTADAVVLIGQLVERFGAAVRAAGLH